MTLPLDEGNPFQKSPSFFRLLFFTTYWPFHQQLARRNKHPISQPVQSRITRVVRRDVWFTFYYANDLSGIFSGFWCEQSPPNRTEYSEGKGKSAFFCSSHMLLSLSCGLRFCVQTTSPWERFSHAAVVKYCYQTILLWHASRPTSQIFIRSNKTKLFEWLKCVDSKYSFWLHCPFLKLAKAGDSQWIVVRSLFVYMTV